MKTLSIMNLKGGVAKTITAINLACELTERGHNVIIIDNDQQGSISQFFQCYGYEQKTLADILLAKEYSPQLVEECIHNTNNSHLDVISANLDMAEANNRLIVEYAGAPYQMRLRNIMPYLSKYYDFCIIDNGPSLCPSFISAMVASDDIIIPVKMDRFTFEGISNLIKQIGQVKSYWNSTLSLMGILITQYKNDNIHNQGIDYLTAKKQYPILKTVIHYSPKVSESTFGSDALAVYSGRSKPAKEYSELADEYLAYLKGGAQHE